jgi:hypothetical protein
VEPRNEGRERWDTRRERERERERKDGIERERGRKGGERWAE